MSHPFRIGVISDTHGLLRPEALAVFAGVDAILHAGDVGNIEILDALQAIAPVTAIRGNVDIDGPCAALPATEFVTLAAKNFYLIHNLRDLDLKPEGASIDVVISGHTHQPLAQARSGVLYFNPGSAGPRRFELPVCLGFITVDGSNIESSIENLL